MSRKTRAAAIVQLHGVTAKVVLEESVIDPNHVRVTLIVDPRTPGLHSEVYNSLVKKPPS